jgi:hypothetical protein
MDNPVPRNARDGDKPVNPTHKGGDMHDVTGC